MRTITTVLTLTAITTIVAAYYFMREDAAPEQPQVASQTGATSGLEVQDKLDELASVLERYQQTNEAQLQQTQLQQVRLDKMLADLDTRLRSVETAGGEQTSDAAIANSGAQASDAAVSNSGEQVDTANSGGQNPEPAKVSEADLGHWMDEILSAGYWDAEATMVASEQVGNNLTKVPGVNLEDMQCGERFCRATFAHENGGQPAILDLYGEPPFVTEGFTINEADGRVLFYFMRPGVSLSELRNEAGEAGQ